MRILVSGGTGLVGQKVCEKLFAEGHELVVLTRNASRAARSFSVPASFVEWRPDQALDLSGVGAVDAALSLAGESVGEGRWTKERKRSIYDSRVQGTRQLVEALEKLPSKPRVLVSASAVGFYGDCGAEWVDESRGPGQDFLASVCQAWESEAHKASFRSVQVRIGVVLSTRGGALGKLVPLFRSGLGGPVGSGKQYMSWIHIDDLVAILTQALSDERYRGPINAVAPDPATNREFSRALAAVLQKPCLMAAPSFALRLALGEMSTVVLSGQRVRPERLEALGFQFVYRELDQALASLVRPDAQVYEATQWIPRPVDEVFSFFSAAKNLEQITPPWLNFHIVGMSRPEIAEGTLIDYRLKLHGLPLKWRTLIEKWQPGQMFVDTQLKGPYSLWHHTHEFSALRGGTWMTDRVLFRLPMGSLGRWVAGSKVESDVSRIFAFRRDKITELYGSISR